MGISNVFVFPREEFPKEGLGLVVVESQTAGLPMVLSKGIVTDAILIDKLATFLPLSQGPTVWAETISNIIDEGLPMDRKTAYDKMSKSYFNIAYSAKRLLENYY